MWVRCSYSKGPFSMDLFFWCTLTLQVLFRKFSRRDYSSVCWAMGLQHVPLPSSMSPCLAEVGALAAPHSQALDGHMGLFPREDCVAPAKWYFIKLHLLGCFTGLGCRSLNPHLLHRQSFMYEKARVCSLFLLWFTYVLLLSDV